MNERMNRRMNERLNEWINEIMTERMNEWMKERINKRKKHGDVWIVNCESQRYRTIKQRHHNGLVNIHTYILRLVNIYTVIQEL